VDRPDAEPVIEFVDLMKVGLEEIRDRRDPAFMDSLRHVLQETMDDETIVVAGHEGGGITQIPDLQE
jgi:hypothetical protein